MPFPSPGDLPFPFPGNLLTQESNLGLLHWQVDSLLSEPHNSRFQPYGSEKENTGFISWWTASPECFCDQTLTCTVWLQEHRSPGVC